MLFFKSFGGTSWEVPVFSVFRRSIYTRYRGSFIKWKWSSEFSFDLKGALMQVRISPYIFEVI